MQDFKKSASTAGLEEEEGKKLAEYRVYQKDCLDYWSKQMTPDQQSARRVYMRKILLHHSKWANKTNNELDNMRLYTVKDCYVVEDSKGYATYLSHAKITEEETEFRKVRAMMPFDFMNLTGKDFKWDKYRMDISGSKDMINKYIMEYPQFKDKGMGLYIYSGTKGSGKTMLACCLINEIAKRYIGSVKFVNVLDFLEMTKKSFKDQEEDINAIYQAGILVLDDIGVQMTKEWVDTVLYRLINKRYVERLPTIYTSNIPIDHLKIDDRITDRIDSTTFPVKLPEESIRKAVRFQEKQELLQTIEEQ